MSAETGGASDTPLNRLAHAILAINQENGWDCATPGDLIRATDGDLTAVRKIGTALALIHSEVSEALEALRHQEPEHFAEELADIVIRCLDLAGGLEIDLDGEVRGKMERNRRRGVRHGGKVV